MKNYYKFLFLLIGISLTSCKSIISNQGKSLNYNSLELNHKYEIQDFKAKIHKIKITSIDGKNVYGISKKGDSITIDKKQIREVKKVKIAGSIVVGIVAIATVIFVPI